MSSFKAGRLKHFIENWREITSDPQILDTVQHCHIDFDKDFNDQEFPVIMSSGKFSDTESEIIEKEIQKLLQLQVICEVEHEMGEIISPIFVVPKKNGESRMIHNLKKTQ